MHSKVEWILLRKLVLLEYPMVLKIILCTQVDFLDQPIAAFVRLSQSLPLGDLTEVSLRTRFFFDINIDRE